MIPEIDRTLLNSPTVGCATRYCWNTDTRTHAAANGNDDRQTPARPVRLPVVADSVRLGSHHPSLSVPLSHVVRRRVYGGDRHQRDLPSYVAQSVQPPARSLSSSSSVDSSWSSVHTLNVRLSLRRCLRGGVDVDVVCAADAARLRNVTYLLRAQLTASRSPPPSFTASR